MIIRITDTIERNVFFEYDNFSIVTRQGVNVVTVRHPTATDFEHDSLVMAEIYLTKIEVTYGHEVSLGFDAHMIGVYEWGSRNPLAGAKPCTHCDSGHLITKGETYFPKVDTLKRYLSKFRSRDPYAVPVRVDFLDQDILEERRKELA